jgi:hypothetical protein
MRTTGIIAAAAALALTPAATFAQDANNSIDTSYGNPQPQEDDDFPWGLLGLLGLAGLIPRKKAPDVHIDNRSR